MRWEGGLLGSCMLMAWILGGCSKGVDDDTGGLTFGPVDPTNAAATQGPIDPTTSGGGEVSDDDTTASVDDDTTAGLDGDGATSTGEPEPETGSTDGSTGPAAPVCGDGVAEPGEDCDGVDLAGLSCSDVDPTFTGGTLACDGACAFDTSGCSAADNPIVVCQPVNAAISDNSTTSNQIVLPANQLGGTITDVDVEVELDHTFIGDLEIDVTSNGTSVIVFDNLCSTQDDLHATFDDQAGAALSCPSSDASTSATPSFPLSAFNGGAVTANWTIDVADQAGADQGTLQQWCVTITWM